MCTRTPTCTHTANQLQYVQLQPHVTIAQRVYVPRFYKQLGCCIFREGKRWRLFRVFHSFHSPPSTLPYDYFFPFFFYCQPFPQRFNNLSKAVNREIDRRSSRKLLLRCIRLKVLFTYVSWNLFVRGTCFAAQCRPFDTRENPVEEIEQISTVCNVRGGKKLKSANYAHLALQRGFARTWHFKKQLYIYICFWEIFVFIQKKYSWNSRANRSHVFQYICVCRLIYTPLLIAGFS